MREYAFPKAESSSSLIPHGGLTHDALVCMENVFLVKYLTSPTHFDGTGECEGVWQNNVVRTLALMSVAVLMAIAGIFGMQGSRPFQRALNTLKFNKAKNGIQDSTRSVWRRRAPTYWE